MIKHLRLQIAKLRREQYGHSAERHARLIEPLELQPEDREAGQGAGRSRSICRASACWSRRRPPASAAARGAS
ncbi:IS66 family transposase [Falsigemmobacter faecalis]|uniref:IS66 family transposase n=1 Tax=Falsigemmobacter faecalis TaxID=2488730 RepID=UPI00389905A2